MFTFEVNKNEIKMTEHETVTSGSVNAYFCQFTFSDDWEGLAKTITFRAGDVSVSVLLDSTNICSIPWEVLEKDAVQLYVGARGTVTDSDTEEEAVIPTVYCLIGTIRKGTELGDNAQPPAPSIVDQIMNRIETLDEEKQDKLRGAEGQVVSFDAYGNVIARDEKGTEYKAGENISISEDHTISATMYDDAEIRGEINDVKSKTEENAAGIVANEEAIAGNAAGIAANAEAIAKNTSDIAKNSEAITKNAVAIAGNAANIAKNSEDIAKNAESIAKNTEDVKTVSDKVDTLNTSISTLSKSVTDNTEAIKTAGEDIAALSSSVTAATEAIAKNTAGLSEANTKISELEASKQDKLHGTEGQVVSFDADGNVIARDEKGTEYKAGENISISDDNTISATAYDDTEIRGEIDNVNRATAANVEGIAANSEAIVKNAEDISTNAADIAKNKTDIAKNKTDIAGNAANIAKNTADIAKNTADIKTISDKSDALTSSLSALSKSVTDNTEAINTAEENIAALSSSVTAAAEAIAKNTAGLSEANTKILELEASKQDKLRGAEGQVVGFDKDGNAIAQEGGVGAPGADGVTFTPMVSPEGVISWTNDGGLPNPEPTNIMGPQGPQGVAGANGADGVNGATFTPSVSSDGKLTWTNDGGLPNPEPTNIMGPQGPQGDKGDTGPAGMYTAGDNISISPDNVISADMYDDTAIKSQISTLENDVNTSLGVLQQRINGKQNTLSAGYGINISGSTIEFSATASTRFLYTANGMNTGGTTISSITNFSVTSQTSNLSTVFEYMRIGTGTSIRACYSFRGNLSAKIKASVTKTYFAGNPISVTMSQSASFTEFAGFATIVVSGSTYLCLVKTGGGKTLTLYPTEEFTISSGTSATLMLYL